MNCGSFDLVHAHYIANWSHSGSQPTRHSSGSFGQVIECLSIRYRMVKSLNKRHTVSIALESSLVCGIEPTLGSWVSSGKLAWKTALDISRNWRSGELKWYCIVCVRGGGWEREDGDERRGSETDNFAWNGSSPTPIYCNYYSQWTSDDFRFFGQAQTERARMTQPQLTLA